MPKTAVGLFQNRNVVGQVVRDIESAGFPRTEVRAIGEPLDLGVTGVLSIPRVDFEVDLFRELSRMGASRTAAQAYVDGVRSGGVLVFATGSDDQVVQAAGIMNRHGAVQTQEDNAPEPHLHSRYRESGAALATGTVQTGRLRQGGGACLFFW